MNSTIYYPVFRKPKKKSFIVRGIFILLILFQVNISMGQMHNWSFALQKKNKTELAHDIAYDKLGNIYLTGVFEDSLDIDPSNNTQLYVTGNVYPNVNAILAKYNANGSLIWGIKIGNGLGKKSNISFSKMVIDNNNDIYVCGQFSDSIDFDPSANKHIIKSTFSGAEPFIAKYSSTGNFLWVKVIRSSTFGDNRGNAITIDNLGNLVFTGGFHGKLDLDPSPSGMNMVTATGSAINMFVIKLDANGNYIWGFNVSSTLPIEVICDNNNDILITGTLWFGASDFNPGSASNILYPLGQRDAFVAKYSANGLYQWAFNLGGTGADDGKKILVDNTNTVFVCGEYGGTMDINPGTAYNAIYNKGGADIFVASYSSSGNCNWGFGLGDTNDDRCFGFELDKNNDLLLFAQLLTMQTDIDPSSINTVNYSFFNNNKTYMPLIKYSTGGAYLSHNDILENGGYLWDRLIDFEMDNLKNSFTIAGTYSIGYLNFNFPNPSNILFGYANDTDIFMANFLLTQTSVTDLINSNAKYNLFPNPFNDKLNITGLGYSTKIEIYNSLNQLVHIANSTASDYSVDLSFLSKGIYYARIESDKQLEIQKIIKH